MTTNKRIDAPTGTSTVGHEWDGIEELDTPMPRWWLITFYLCIAFAIGYVILYPAIPMLSRGTEGALGWTSRGELDRETKAANGQRAALIATLNSTPIEQLSENSALLQAAVTGGRAAFRVNCVQCHGSGAAGSKGYPNLNDDDWLWGGDMKALEYTIKHGVRQAGDDLTRTSQMPSFGRDAILDPKQVADVASFVRTLSRREPASAASQRGAPLFANNCAACHGPAGLGNRQFGAPNLADAIWLYGGSRQEVAASINVAHAGVMPAWDKRLDPATIKMLAAYVHSLGGGEKFVEAAPAVPPAPASAPATSAGEVKVNAGQ